MNHLQPLTVFWGAGFAAAIFSGQIIDPGNNRQAYLRTPQVQALPEPATLSLEALPLGGTRDGASKAQGGTDQMRRCPNITQPEPTKRFPAVSLLHEDL